MQIGSLAIELLRKPIKHLNISLLPPDGRVRVSAPTRMTETAIRMAVVKRLPWIHKHQVKFQQQVRESQREMLTGESHYLWGKRYRLDVVERVGKHQVIVEKDRLIISVSPNTSTENRQLVIQNFYRKQLKTQLPTLLDHWLPMIGVSLNAWRIQQMKTRWGSCAIHSKRILLNLELAKKPVACLEYVLVHELVHLLEASHNARFYALMDHFLPNWKETKAVLASCPIAD
jgi:predicted metal-dependent hydrolase